jgi:hypothetical protein
MFFVKIKSDPNLGVGQTNGMYTQQDGRPSCEVMFRNGDSGTYYKDDIEMLDPRLYETSTQLQLVSEDSHSDTRNPCPPFWGDI